MLNDAPDAMDKALEQIARYCSGEQVDPTTLKESIILLISYFSVYVNEVSGPIHDEEFYNDVLDTYRNYIGQFMGATNALPSVKQAMTIGIAGVPREVHHLPPLCD